MYDNSIMYGLRNPAFTEDLGMSMVNQMFPIPPGPMGVYPMMMPPGQLRGQLNVDTFNSSQRETKDNKIFKRIALGFAALIGTIAGFKYGGKIVQFVKNFIPKKP